MKKYLILSALFLALALASCDGKLLTEKYTAQGTTLIFEDEVVLTAKNAVTLTDSFLIADNGDTFDIYVDRRAAKKYTESGMIILDDFVKIERNFTDAALFDGKVIAADGNTLVLVDPMGTVFTSEKHEKLLDVSESGALVIADGQLMLTSGIGDPLPIEITPEMFDTIPVRSWDNIDAHSIHQSGAMIRCGSDVYSVMDTGSTLRIEYDELLMLYPIGASVVDDGKYRLIGRDGKTLIEWYGYKSGMKLATEIVTDYKGEYYSDGAVYNLRFDDGASGGMLLSYDYTADRLLIGNGLYNFSFNADGKIDVIRNKNEHVGTFDDLLDNTTPLLIRYGETTELYHAGSTPITKLANVVAISDNGEYCVTETGIYNSKGARVLDLPSYLYSGTSDAEFSFTNYGAKIDYKDDSGDPVTLRWYAELPIVDKLPQDMDLIDQYYEYGGLYSDGESYWIVKDTGEIVKLPLDSGYSIARINYANTTSFYETIFGEDGIKILETTVSFPESGLLVKEGGAMPGSVTEFSGYNIVFDVGSTSLILDKNGTIVDCIDTVTGFIKDDLLYFGFYDNTNVQAVYSSSMKRFSDQPFDVFYPLDDGRYIAKVGNRYQIYTKDGEMICESEEFEQLMYVDDVIMFVEDGEIVIAEIVLGTDNYILERNTRLGEYDSSWVHHVMLSGKIEKPSGGYPSGYYFIFEDPNRTDGQGNPRLVEYYYVPETGKTGIYESYASFAYAKPVLYLYPEETTEVTVTFPYSERMTTVYPVYNDGWRVTAEPDGTLTDARGHEYYALYWEEDSGEIFYDFPDGFVVTPDNAVEFLEQKLAILGLTDREANEFIMYWLPILEANPYNLVRFELTEEREQSMPMHITPTPDSLLRIAIHIMAVEHEIILSEQELPSFTREGFTAIEWGGCVH